MKLRKSFSLITILFVVLGFTELAQAFYNPETGRFLSRDPIEERGGENLYAFVKNDGIRHADKLGNRPVLTASESEPFSPRDCGAFRWKIDWAVSPAASGFNGGAILQEIELSWKVEDCMGNKMAVTKTFGKGKVEAHSPYSYYEAWGVKSGTTTVRIDAGMPGGSDTFASSSFGTCTKGTFQAVGFARYYPTKGLADLPGNWSTGWWDPSGSLWSGQNRPDWPTTPDARSQLVKHSIVVKWNCCPTSSDVKKTEKIYSTIETISGS